MVPLRIYLFSLLFLSLFGKITAQNLVPNPSFENYIACPTGSGQIDSLQNWFVPVNHGGTPDYYNSCDTGSLGVPHNFTGYQFASSGNGYIGLINYATLINIDYREYIQVRLTTPLIANKTYRVSFKCCLAEYSQYATNDIDICFTNSPISGSGNYSIISMTPQLTSTPMINDTSIWINVSQQFTASGGEEYLTIGNFKNNLSTNIINANSNPTSNLNYTYLDDFSVVMDCNFEANLGNDTSLCIGDTLTLNVADSNVTNYLWSNNSTDSIITITQSGTYWVALSDSGCISTDTITVLFDTTQTINLGIDTTLCDGETMILDASIPNCHYLWSDSSMNPTLAVTQSGMYWVQVNNACGAYSDSISLTFQPLPSLSLGRDTAICLGDSILLNPNSSNAVSYLWQDSATSPTYMASQFGKYTVTVNDGKCSNSDSKNIRELLPPKVSLGGDTTICEGIPIRLLGGVLHNQTYLWQDMSTSPTLLTNQAGLYSVAVSNACGTVSDSINISSLEVPIINLGSDTIICENSELTIYGRVKLAESYLWQDNSDNSVKVINQPGTYILTASNRCGSSTDSIIVVSKICDCISFIPNAFSPNYDGLNDFFSPKFNCTFFDNYKFEIFNRWGQKVFQTNSTNGKWNGLVDNTAATADVYFYKIQYSSNGKSKTIGGDLTLIR